MERSWWGRNTVTSFDHLEIIFGGGDSQEIRAGGGNERYLLASFSFDGSSNSITTICYCNLLFKWRIVTFVCIQALACIIRKEILLSHGFPRMLFYFLPKQTADILLEKCWGLLLIQSREIRKEFPRPSAFSTTVYSERIGCVDGGVFFSLLLLNPVFKIWMWYAWTFFTKVKRSRTIVNLPYWVLCPAGKYIHISIVTGVCCWHPKQEKMAWSGVCIFAVPYNEEVHKGFKAFWLLWIPIVFFLLLLLNGLAWLLTPFRTKGSIGCLLNKERNIAKFVI